MHMCMRMHMHMHMHMHMLHVTYTQARGWRLASLRGAAC